MEYFIGTLLTVSDQNNMKSPIDCIRLLLLHALNSPLPLFSPQKTPRYISDCDVCYVDATKRLRKGGERIRWCTPRKN